MITRNNWREHCTEPELTAEEQQQITEMVAKIVSCANFCQYIQEQTEDEYDALIAAEQWTGLEPSWALMPTWADAQRRWRRAELAAWRKWQELESKPEQLELEL